LPLARAQAEEKGTTYQTIAAAIRSRADLPGATRRDADAQDERDAPRHGRCGSRRRVADHRPETGEDVTNFHVNGAQYALEIAEIIGARRAYLKGGSPSCDRRV